MKKNCDNVGFYLSIDLPLLEKFTLSYGFESSLSRVLWFQLEGLALALYGRASGNELHQLLPCLSQNVLISLSFRRTGLLDLASSVDRICLSALKYTISLPSGLQGFCQEIC